MSMGAEKKLSADSSRIDALPETQQAKSIGAILDAKTSKPVADHGKPIYYFESKRALVCLLFLLPLMAWYEFGKFVLPWLSDGAQPNPGLVEGWLMALVGQAGFALAGMVPVLTTGILLMLHHRRKRDAPIRPTVFFSMAIEIIGISLLLFLFGDAILLFAEGQQPRPLVHLFDFFRTPQWHAVLLESLGAGLQEELIFRLILFNFASIWLAKTIGDELVAVTMVAIFVSVLFAAAHCDFMNPDASPFRASTFLFRFFASLVLCVLFRFRGFAIAVGVHFGFDLLATAG